MFQVTDSRRSYKNFLFGILDFVHRATGEARTTLLSSEFETSWRVSRGRGTTSSVPPVFRSTSAPVFRISSSTTWTTDFGTLVSELSPMPPPLT